MDQHRSLNEWLAYTRQLAAAAIVPECSRLSSDQIRGLDWGTLLRGTIQPFAPFILLTHRGELLEILQVPKSFPV